MKYLFGMCLIITLIGAGCEAQYDENGCVSYDNACKAVHACMGNGGAPTFGPSGGYRGCDFPQD